MSDDLESVLDLEAALVRLRLIRTTVHCVQTLERATGDVSLLETRQAVQFWATLGALDELRTVLASPADV